MIFAGVGDELKSVRVRRVVVLCWIEPVAFASHLYSSFACHTRTSRSRVVVVLDLEFLRSWGLGVVIRLRTARRLAFACYICTVRVAVASLALCASRFIRPQVAAFSVFEGSWLSSFVSDLRGVFGWCCLGVGPVVLAFRRPSPLRSAFTRRSRTLSLRRVCCVRVKRVPLHASQFPYAANALPFVTSGSGWWCSL